MKFTIGVTQNENGTHQIECRETKTSFPSGNVTRDVAVLVAEIEDKWESECEGTKRRFRLAPPDDGARTPIHAFWQSMR